MENNYYFDFMKICLKWGNINNKHMRSKKSLLSKFNSFRPDFCLVKGMDLKMGDNSKKKNRSKNKKNKNTQKNLSMKPVKEKKKKKQKFSKKHPKLAIALRILLILVILLIVVVAGVIVGMVDRKSVV